MEKINYLDILKHAWQITWNNKYLWWLGLFLILGGSGGGLNYSFGGGNEKKEGEKIVKFFENVISNYWELLLVGIISLLVLVIIAIILQNIARGGLIKSVSKIISGKGASFRSGFADGRRYFWKILLTGFLIGFFIIGIVLAFLSPIIYLIFLKAYLAAALLALIAVPLVIVIGIVASYVRGYAYMYLVLSNLDIKSSLERSFQIFYKNAWPSIIFSLILMVVRLIVGFATLIALLLAGLPFLILGLVLYLLLAKLGLILAVALGSLFLIFLFLFLQSILEVFYQTAWILFFQKIAAVKSEESQEEKIKVTGKILDAEGA